ncbi:hypothetical protein BC940DRAFT_259850, partial [Gongronella butleri]
MERLPPIYENNDLSIGDSDRSKFKPHTLCSPATRLKVKKAKYSTSLDSRGYIPVYEYMINCQPIMWDRETGYVHFTGIWKALGNSKSDIVKMVDSNPELKVKKVRGGFLKIQGTWIPYDFAYILCRRTAWNIRHELTVMFGPRFATEALNPTHAEYGCLLLNPKNAHLTRGICAHRGNGFTNARQSCQQPYTKMKYQDKRCYMDGQRLLKKTELETTPNNAMACMSLTRLLNTDTNQSVSYVEQKSKSDYDTLKHLDHSTSMYTESPHTTPSPTLRGSAFSPEDNKHQMMLPPITTNFHWKDLHSVHVPVSPPVKELKITPVESWPGFQRSQIASSGFYCHQQNQPGLHQDIVDTINATIMLQRLSQDNGERPFRPMPKNTIPNRVIVGDQEYALFE